MKILTKITILASLLAIGLGTTLATTTDQLELSVSGLTATFVDNVVGCTGTGCSGLSGDLNSAAGELVVLGTIGGWDITVTTGKSYSPSDVPVGLDLASLTATCAAGAACDNETLSISYSDINFVADPAGYGTDYSATIAGSGSTSQSAYWDSSNTIFGTANLTSHLIGTVGPFITTNHGSASSAGSFTKPNSLTLEQAFTAVGTSGVSFSVDGDVYSTPEPGAVILLGTVLLFCASKLRRRRAS